MAGDKEPEVICPFWEGSQMHFLRHSGGLVRVLEVCLEDKQPSERQLIMKSEARWREPP